MSDRSSLHADAKEILAGFEQKVGLSNVDFELKERTDGPVLSVLLGKPTDRFFRALKEASDEARVDNTYRERVTIKKHSPDSWVLRAETRLLQRVLSESLTVSEHSFEEDFFSRYIPSVVGAENQILATGNHIVFGRRGSGKSSLLVYAMRKYQATKRPYAWIAMQTYDRRSDIAVAADIIIDVLEQINKRYDGGIVTDAVLHKLETLLEKPRSITAEKLRLLVPDLKRALALVVAAHGPFTVFLDDFHVVSATIQPELLSVFYAFCRGNQVSLKVSAIEQFTRVWDPATRAGLETPNDAQVIRLDYNLTKPDKSLEHISSILSAHAAYCGLPSIAVLCPKGAMSRLVWVAAGVPRDAINMFVQALVSAVNEGEKHVSITGINLAASQAADDKMRFVEMDSSGAFKDALKVLERIKIFCTREKKKNAFLVESKNDDPFFENIRKLIDLRLLHVLHPGITPGEAGVRWLALLLDYGFYTGVRAGKSIDLFQSEAKAPEVKELRKLPRFRSESDDGKKASPTTTSRATKSRKVKAGNAKTKSRRSAN